LAISDAVDDKQIDLLVVGWRGRVRRRHYFFGDVLDATVANAQCDVAMMVRPAASFLDKSARIVVPLLTDLHTARLALETAVALAADRQLPMMTLHVTAEPETQRESIAARLAQQAADLHATVNLSQAKQKIIHAKNICGTLLSEIKADDLVVVEAIPEGLFNRHFFGEIPERRARELTGPVILTKTYPGDVVSWFQKLFGTRMPEPHELDA
jgi:nucleotide-binding universal stress UspA family protein